MLPGGLYRDSSSSRTHTDTHINGLLTIGQPSAGDSTDLYCVHTQHTPPDKNNTYEKDVHSHGFMVFLCLPTTLWTGFAVLQETFLCVSTPLLSVSRSVFVCKLQRQHHMAHDSFHTVSLCSAKLRNPCQRDRGR